MFVEAEYDILRRLAPAPFVSVVYVGKHTFVDTSRRNRNEKRTMSGDDPMQVEDVRVQCVPERVVLARILIEGRSLGRAGAQSVSYLFSVRCQFGGSLADGWI